MASQEEFRRSVVDYLNRLGQEYKSTFKEFDVEQHSSGKYRAGNWTYKISRSAVSLEYWFSAFSSRKEEAVVTFPADGDAKKLENDLRSCFDKVREAVKRKKGMF